MKKILIVDDMEVSLLIIENILSSQYTTFCASSGREAIEIYHREQPDMVLSDLRMPGMSGYELQQALQQEYHEPIPFMFMTADQNEEMEAKGFDNGAMDFIRKPIRPDVLLRRISNILQTVSRIQGLKKHASTDALTGLLNKASVEGELRRICRKTSGALLMIDLDSFKLVNDIYGHAMGDKVLVSFADVIRSAMRPADIVGRLGGDEFVAYCPELQDEATVAHKAQFINERLLAAARQLMGEDMTIPLGASIGCAFAPEGGAEFAALSEQADKALYIVKQNGKHGYHVFSGEHEEDGEATRAIGLGHVEMILGERSQKDGAFDLPFESFRAIYRFLCRTKKIYCQPTYILLFSLAQGDAAPPAAVCDEFFSVLRSVLRKSDAVTQNGKNQFIVLLTGLDHAVLPAIIERIHAAWKALPASHGTSLSHESSSLAP